MIRMDSTLRRRFGSIVRFGLGLINKQFSHQQTYELIVSYVCSCSWLLPLEPGSGTRSAGALSVPEVDLRRVRVSMLRWSRLRASCFLERSCNMRE